MISTVTLNPCLDLFVDIDRFEYDAVLKARSSRVVGGGKGINLARVARMLGSPARAWFLAGGALGQELTRQAISYGIEARPIESNAPTRINVVLADGAGRHLKANAPGDETEPRVLDALCGRLAEEAASAGALALTGSLPPGLPEESWARLVRLGRDLGVPVFVDVSGLPLRAAVAARPTGLKVNRLEVQELTGRTIQSMAELADAAASIVDSGVEMVCLTDGSRGAVLVDRTGAWQCDPPASTAKRAVGAGDALLAGLLVEYVRGGRASDLLRSGIGSGAAWALAEVGCEPGSEEVARLCAVAQVRAIG